MSRDLYVKHIAADISEEELRKLFSVCGKVNYIHMVKDAKTHQFLGCAYVKMGSEAEARDAIVTLDGAHLGNRDIIVVAALPQRPAGAAKPGTEKTRNRPPAPGRNATPGASRGKGPAGSDRPRSDSRQRPSGGKSAAAKAPRGKSGRKT